MHTDVRREGGREVAAQVNGRLLHCVEVAPKKKKGGPVCVTEYAPREVEGAKATAGLPQRVTRCCWTCFLESNYIRAHESHCKHE